MKANELRIGNWYYTNDGKPEQIDGHGISQFQDGEVLGQVNDFIKPIPLTEEWLLKFGFEKYPYLDKYKLIEKKGFIKKESSYMVLCYFLNGYGFCTNHGEDMQSFGNLSIEYVHQLQNLYFALTGQELEKK
jgi:hypothetical protein